MIRNAVLHINNEQPLLADLFTVPAASDVAVLCTNLRTLNGKRPVFADDSASVFLFPLAHLRFIEILPGTVDAGGGLPDVGLEVVPETSDLDGELEIDEELLRRVRDA
jgi:hypothetical protein